MSRAGTEGPARRRDEAEADLLGLGGAALVEHPADLLVRLRPEAILGGADAEAAPALL
jgi:hypothetical protein